MLIYVLSIIKLTAYYLGALSKKEFHQAMSSFEYILTVFVTSIFSLLISILSTDGTSLSGWPLGFSFNRNFSEPVHTSQCYTNANKYDTVHGKLTYAGFHAVVSHAKIWTH